METVFLAFGGNAGPTKQLFEQALDQLGGLALSPIQVSNYYRTSPVECPPMQDFLNAACRFDTHLSAWELFQRVEEIERQLGKVPKPKNAARPIDIDLIFYGNQVVNLPGLQIPHPRWRERLFVLRPLRDLAEGIVIDNQWVSFERIIEIILKENQTVVSKAC